MNADWFRFDPEITHAEGKRHRVRIRTGMSVLARNRITALAMQHPVERAKLWTLLMQQGDELREGVVSDRIDHPGVMETQPFAYWVEPQQRTIVLALVWGYILRGQPRSGIYRGDFIFGVVGDEEIDTAAADLFHTTRKVTA